MSEGKLTTDILCSIVSIGGLNDDNGVLFAAILADGGAFLCLDLGVAILYILDSAGGVLRAPGPGDLVTFGEIVSVRFAASHDVALRYQVALFEVKGSFFQNEGKP